MVKRYDVDGCAPWFEADDGGFVDYEDYSALEARCAALAAENAALKSASSCLVSEYMMNKGADNEFIACITPSKKTIGTSGVWDMWRHLDMALDATPATDAFLAEVRAQGVEMFARSLRGEAEITKACTFKSVQQFEEFAARADDFAAQLRQEAAQ